MGLVLCLLLCVVTSSYPILCNFDFTVVTASDTQAVDSLNYCPSYDLGGGDSAKYPDLDYKGIVFSEEKLISTSDYLYQGVGSDESLSFGGWFYYIGGEIGVFLSFTQETASQKFIETTFEKQVGSMLIDVRVNGDLRLTINLEFGWQWLGSVFNRDFGGYISLTYCKTWGKTNGVNRPGNRTRTHFMSNWSGEMWMGCHSSCPSGASFIIKDFYFQDDWYLGGSTSSDYNLVPYNRFFWAGKNATKLRKDMDVTCWDHAPGSDTSALDSNCYVKEGKQCTLDDPSYTHLNETSHIYCGQAPNCGNGAHDSRTEDCEDGNTVGGDGCENNCTISIGFECSPNSTSGLSDCTAIPCNVNNCAECVLTDAELCTICEEEYILSADNRSCSIDKKLTDSSTAHGATFGAVAIASIVFAVTKVGTPQEIWLSMNFLQMVNLVLIFRVKLPKSIKQYISGMGSFAFPISFLSINKIPSVTGFIKKLGEEVEDEKYLDYDLDSTSVLREKISAVSVLFLSAAAAIFFFWLNKCLANWLERHRKWNIVLKWCQRFFTWNFFWRIAITEEISLLVISIYELKLHYLGRIESNPSPDFAILVIQFFILKTVVLLMTLRSFLKEYDSDKYYMNGEFFSGFKSQKWPWLQVVWTTLRKHFFIIVVVIVEPALEAELTWLLLTFQVLYLAAICIVRPLKQTSHNVIEIVCETVYCLFLTILVVPKSNNEWPGWMEYICEFLLFSNNFLILLISMGFGIVSLCKWCWNRRRRARADRVEQRPRLPAASSNDGASQIQLNREDASGISESPATPPVTGDVSQLNNSSNQVPQEPKDDDKEETKMVSSSQPVEGRLSDLPEENPNFKEEEEKTPPKSSKSRSYSDSNSSKSFHGYNNQKSFPIPNIDDLDSDFSPQDPVDKIECQPKEEVPTNEQEMSFSFEEEEKTENLGSEEPQEDPNFEPDFSEIEKKSNWKESESDTKVAEKDKIEEERKQQEIEKEMAKKKAEEAEAKKKLRQFKKKVENMAAQRYQERLQRQEAEWQKEWD